MLHTVELVTVKTMNAVKVIAGESLELEIIILYQMYPVPQKHLLILSHYVDPWRHISTYRHS